MDPRTAIRELDELIKRTQLVIDRERDRLDAPNAVEGRGDRGQRGERRSKGGDDRDRGDGRH
jgi:hypothetical protein